MKSWARGERRKIILGGRQFHYFLRRSPKAKYLGITVSRPDSFFVTMPEALDFEQAQAFIRKKAPWILKKLKSFSEFKKQPYALLGSRREYLKLKNAALALAADRLDYFNKIYNFAYRRVSVKNQKTRWGSCSRSGNLNFNYRIALLPPRLADYIIVHELCHLKEPNHSRNFWALVNQVLPAKLLRDELMGRGRRAKI